MNVQNRRQRRTSEQTDEGAGSDGSLPESWSSLNDERSLDNKEIAALELELQNKMKSLNERQSRIDKMDEELINLTEKQKQISSLGQASLIDNKLLLASRTKEQLEEILQRKRSLSLNLKRALPSSPGGRSSGSYDGSDEMLSTTDQLLRSAHRGDGGGDGDRDENHNRKRKIVAALNLIYNAELEGSLDDAGDGDATFHTAAADSPGGRRFPGLARGEVEKMELEASREKDGASDCELDFKTSTDEMRVFRRCANADVQEGPEASRIECTLTKNDELCSTTTLSCENRAADEQPADDDPPQRPASHPESILERSEAMRRLERKIARQRGLVMKCLESSPTSKDELNRQIGLLQDLHRQQIELEVSLLEQERRGRAASCDPAAAEQAGGDATSTSTILGGEDRDGPSSSAATTGPEDGSTTGGSATSLVSSCSVTRSSRPRSGLPSSEEEDEQRPRRPTSRLPQPRGYSSVYLTSQNRGERLTSPYALTITRSLPSLVPNSSESVVSVIVSVPTFVIRGAGTSSHYEYEVRVVAVDDSWTLLRRFRRFRELYVSMRESYGGKVSGIRFPPRQMFARYEVIARQRRKCLEEYLRRLIQVCSELPSCEPLYKFKGNLSSIDKQSLLEFSSFFRRGTFESSKYGTS